MSRSKSMKKYNPERFHNDMVSLAEASPTDAAEVASTWRGRYENAVNSGQQMLVSGIEVALSGVTAGFVGFLDGGWEARRADLIQKWEEGGAVADGENPDDSSPFVEGGESDPTKVFGVDRVLVMVLVSAGIAVTGIAQWGTEGKKDYKDFRPFVKAIALGTAAYWAGSMGRELGFDRAVDKIKTEESEGQEEAA